VSFALHNWSIRLVSPSLICHGVSFSILAGQYSPQGLLASADEIVEQHAFCCIC
jgi:hypothetical protein